MRVIVKNILIFLVLVCFPAAVGFAETVEADRVPWSGHWWPFRFGGLVTGIDYRGNPSPLEKYELYRQGATEGPSVAWYRNKYYRPAAEPWHGHCGDWAKAAAWENFQILPASIDNVVFRVGDKKGLLTIAHDQDLSEWGDGSDPVQFHYWMLNYIRDRKRPFIADLDPGNEAWNYPIFKYDMTTVALGSRESIRVTVYYADDNVEPDYIGTRVQQETYTYDIQVDGDGRITGGQWTGLSIKNHPEAMFASILPDPGTDTIDYQGVLKIAMTNDDYLENGSGYTEMPNGTYHLVLLDPDRYWIPCGAKDRVRLTVKKVTGSRFAFTAIVKDAGGRLIHNAEVNMSSELKLELDGESSGYFLELGQSDYSDPNIYTVIVDRFAGAVQSVPYVPKDEKWSGFALTNTGDAPIGGVTVVSFDRDGRPIQSLKGPFTLAQKQKKIFLFDDLPWRRHELQSIDHILVLSDSPVSVLNLVGSEKTQTLLSEVQGTASGNHLILPDTSKAFSFGAIAAGKLVNESAEGLPVTLTSFSRTGITDRTVAQTLPSRGSLTLQANEAPFYSLPDGGWIEIKTMNGKPVSGFQTLSSSQQAEGIFAVTASDEKKLVAHIPDPASGWKTTLTLVNASDEENIVILHSARAGAGSPTDRVVTLAPREKTVLGIGDPFGKGAGDSRLRSILEITGSAAFGGYYSYEKATGGDTASYSLINSSDSKDELVLQHCASSSGTWWTGIGIFNADGRTARITAHPYDQAGVPMASAVREFTLNPGAYDVFLAHDFFGTAAPAVSFVRFLSDSGASIGGFYLYGKETSRMLGGANM